MMNGNLIKKAAVMAAGKGTRLRPYTESLPKPLVSFHGKPMIAYTLSMLDYLCFKKVAINIFYEGQKLKEWIEHNQNDYAFSIWASDERSQLLNTGGGVRQMQHMLDEESVLVCNSDTHFVDPKQAYILQKMIQCFDDRKMDFLFLMCLKDTMIGYSGQGDFMLKKESSDICSSTKPCLIGMRDQANINNFQGDFSYVNTGMYIVNKTYQHYTTKGSFSIVDYWKKSAQENRLWGMVFDGIIYDLGTVEGFQQSYEHFQRYKNL